MSSNSIPNELPPSYEEDSDNEEVPFIPRITSTGIGTRRNPNLPSWMLQHHEFGTQPTTTTNAADTPDSTTTPLHDPQIQNEMEYFEIIDDPQPSSLPHTMYIRASQVSMKFARKINSSLIIPVQQMIVDPVAKFWTNMNARVDTTLSRFGNPLMLRRLSYLIIVALTIFAAIALGLIPSNSPFNDGLFGGGRFHDHRKIKNYIKDALSVDSIKNSMDYMTSMSHTSGTSGDYILGQYVENMFNQYAFGPVEFNKERVYLTSPNSTESAMELKLLDSDKNNDIIYNANLWESQAVKNAPQSQAQPRPFHSLSASGEVTGNIIYANYGTKDDYKLLKENHIDLKGSIVFIKTGKMKLGLKILLAQQNGAIGVVTFSEKKNANTKSYPDGPDYTENSVERDDASISAIYPGDILTPGWSSNTSPQRIQYKDARNVPQIPSIPISWKNARPFLQSLKGHGIKVPNWSNNGQPTNIDEWWTGNSTNSKRVFLKNEPISAEKHEVWNVLARIEASEQYDKAIIIGAQRDSFCYGAVEPMSGTAILLEVARVFSILYTKLGWTPLRPIYFVSWDASEQNIAGSTEWVEAHMEDLKRDGLIYIHLDAAISGTKFNAYGHPLFDGVINSILGEITDPIKNTTSVADSYGSSHISTLKDIGDYLPFISHTGVPSITMRFENEDPSVGYPRHSCYDSLDWMKKFGDPDYTYHKTMAEIVSLLLLRFSDDPVVPFNVAAYGERLHHYIRDLQNYAQSSPGYEQNSDKLDFNLLIHAADTMVQGGVYFNEWFNDWLDMVSVGESPMMTGHRWGWNNRLLDLDKHLLERNGLPDRNWFKHVIFGPQLWHPTSGDYEWSTFPGIRDAIEAGNWDRARSEIEHVSTVLSSACDKFIQ